MSPYFRESEFTVTPKWKFSSWNIRRLSLTEKTELNVKCKKKINESLNLLHKCSNKFWGIVLGNHAYVPTLPFWEDTSSPPGLFWNLPFWDDSDLNVKYLWIFQVDHTFYKLDVKFLAANKVRAFLLSTILIFSFRFRSTIALIVLSLAKEESGTSLKINTICSL